MKTYNKIHYRVPPTQYKAIFKNLNYTKTSNNIIFMKEKFRKLSFSQIGIIIQVELLIWFNLTYLLSYIYIYI